MRMQVILDSLFARPGSAPIRGGKKGEFRDWTTDTKAHFALYGISHTFLSDKGPLYSSQEFLFFAKTYGVRLITRSACSILAIVRDHL